MQLTGWDRFCVSVILTSAALGGSYWVATYMLNIPVGHVLTVMTAAVAISAGMRKPVNFLKKWIYFPRWISILLIYVAFFMLIFWVGGRVAPIVSDQVNYLLWVLKTHWVSPRDIMSMLPPWATENMPPEMLEKISTFGKSGVGQIDTYLTGLTTTISNLVTIVLSTSADLVLLLMFIFFLTQRQGLVSRYATALIPSPEKRKIVKDVIDHTMSDLGSWANVQLIIGIFCGTGFGSLISAVGIPAGFTIGLVMGLGETLIPMVGSLVALIVLAMPAGLAHAGSWGLLQVSVIYAVVFFLEWHVVYLYVMGRALKFDAFVTLFFMWIGYFPLGITGSVLVLPILVIASNILKAVCPQMAEDGELDAPAHTQVIQTMMRRIGIDPEIAVRNQLCHRLFGADLHTPLYRQAFSAIVRWVQAIATKLRESARRDPETRDFDRED